MGRTVLTVSVACILSLTSITAQTTEKAAADVNVLARVRTTTAATAGGTPLPAGTYDIRLTDEHPTPLPGQSRDAQRWVEFVANGKVVAREIAEVLQDDDLPEVGASAVRVQSGTRVETAQRRRVHADLGEA